MLIISLVLFQIIIFVVLILIFRKILNKNVVVATRHLEELNMDYSKKDTLASNRLNEAKQKYDEMIARAEGDAESRKADILKEAVTEQQKIIDQARAQGEEIIKQADKSRRLLIQEIEERIYKEAIHKACELIQLALPDKFKIMVHGQWTDELVEESFNQFHQLQVPQDTNEAKVISALPLTDAQKKNLRNKIKELLGKEIELKEEIDSKLVAGMILSIGSLVFDGSLKNKIQEEAERIENEKGSR